MNVQMDKVDSLPP